MSQLRTYRVLPLLVGLALLFGVTAPTVQAVCAMMPGDTQEESLPCHGHEVPVAPMLNLHKADVPYDANPVESYHSCCQPDGTAPAFASILLDAAPRVFGPAVAGGLPDGALRASVQRSATLCTRAHASPFTSPSRRQALLATFLI